MRDLLSAQEVVHRAAADVQIQLVFLRREELGEVVEGGSTVDRNAVHDNSGGWY
jgi:hypothetical protein